jgi:hypothetical protein
MAPRSRQDLPTLLPGTAAGLTAYAVGLGLVVAADFLGVHPGSGIWARNLAGPEYFVLHAGVHVPVWDGTLRTEVLAHTAAVLSSLVVSGALVAYWRDTGAGGFRSGAAVAVGYFPATALSALSAVVLVDAVTPIQMVAPALLAGLVCPVCFGGLGGELAGRFDSGSGGGERARAGRDRNSDRPDS